VRITVQVGDTLGAIARRFGTTMEELQRLNGIQDPDLIFAGQRLEVPEPSTPLPPQEAGPGGEADALLPFGIRGPGPLIKTEPTEHTTSDGQIVTTSWEYPWFISSAQHNATVPQVRAWLRWVFQHSRSWVRAGVWFPEVPRSRDARVVIKYVPDPFECGDVPGATGCCDRQMGPNGQTLIRMGRSRLATPDNPQGFFKGILHEAAHAAFWATHGAGFAYAARKAGIIAQGSAAGIWPTEVDVSSVLAFTQGRNLIKQ
jgi:hypothetical protein